jgi:methylaspartate ammonia-lyase
VRERVRAHGADGYEPTLHIDVYGLAGRQLGTAVGPLVRFCARMAEAAAPLRLQLESPLYGATTAETIERLAALRAALGEAGVGVALVADEFCNTAADVRAFAESGACDMIQLKTPDMGAPTAVIDAALACRAAGLGIFIGGSCTETDGSARVSAHLGLALGADQVLAKPGMGVDEGVAIVRNEMARALLAHRA